MEQKKMQRIVGIVAVLALVAILFPLLFNNADISSQLKTVKAPPFSEQKLASVEQQSLMNQDMASAAEGVVDAPGNEKGEKVALKPYVPEVSEATNQDANAPLAPHATSPVATNREALNPSVNANETNTLDADTIHALEAANQQLPLPPPADATPAVANQPVKVAASEPSKKVKANPPVHKVLATNHAAAPNEKNEKNEKSQKIKKPHAKVASLAANNKSHPSVKPDHATALTQAAWAVQVGSFTHKENAHKLADKLRASGYKAFTHEVKSAKGHIQTRVYIGPEFKQAEAAKLSNRLEHDAKLRGIVIPYKPLAL